jgi:uncharacterized protein YkwD
VVVRSLLTGLVALSGCVGDVGSGRDPRDIRLVDAGEAVEPDGGAARDAGPARSDAGSPGDPDAGFDAGPPPPPGCGNDVEREELALTNAARRSAGLGDLVCDERLTLAARLHSQDMCDQGYFSHTSLDGRTFADRIRAQGATYRTAGENIARGQRTPDDVHEAWMNSEGHRANILNGSFGRIGIGWVACPGSGPYWTQDFTN